MERKLSVLLVLLTIIFLICGCKNNEPKVPKVTGEEAWEKIDALSVGLETAYDDMKGFTFYRCPYDTDENINIVPYVLVYDDYSVALRYHILYSGREPLHFDTLYIKTSEGVKKFRYKEVSILYGYKVIEEYNGEMSEEVYDTLKVAIAEGKAKIRVEGRQKDERYLTAEELRNFAKVFSIYEFLNEVKVK